MTRAFTFGKYYPFHKGHEALVNFTLEKCDEVIVLVCASNSETITGETRATWIRESFPDTNRVKIQVYNYSESDLPNTSVSSKKVSKLWSDQFKLLLPKIDYVITSEKYGDYIAEFMDIKHISFNNDRHIVPISSTLIRSNINANWSYLTSGSKSFFIKKIVLLGTESTGKTTLCKLLAKHYKCDYVTEVARELNIHSNECSIQDLELIAKEHAKSILKISRNSKKPFIIIDTDIHITMSYAQFMFDEKLVTTEEIIKTNKADLYIYLCNDCEFIQDGTRLSKEKRDQLNISHLKTLKENKVPINKIEGDWNTRFLESIRLINLEYLIYKLT